MKIVRKAVYYCDHCKKRSLSAGHMRKHEERCTKNPNRKCGMCAMREAEQPDLKVLMAMLPDPGKHLWFNEAARIPDVSMEEALEPIWDAFWKAAKECPACAMAALRQKGVPVSCATKFDFKKECAAIWAEVNAVRSENIDYGNW
jgi:hypothetical protein